MRPKLRGFGLPLGLVLAFAPRPRPARALGRDNMARPALKHQHAPRLDEDAAKAPGMVRVTQAANFEVFDREAGLARDL